MTRLFEAKPFIIAEVGSNWRSLDDCLKSIEVAKEVGADAVKFQAFTYEALYGPTKTVWGLRLEVGSEETKHELPLAWLQVLKDKADACGIEFMCTAFSPELVAVVDPFVEVHKVASSDAAWPQMLEAVARTKKPVLLSTGAKSATDIDKATKYFETRAIVLLYCVAAYPADYVDVEVMHQLYGDFGDALYEKYGDAPSWGYTPLIGFSDHTLGYSATVEAARRGAIVIEKHFTAFPDLDTPDRPHSLTLRQFRRMVDIIRGRQVESEEEAMYLRHNRRLIASRDIAPGEVLKYGDNFGAYRSLEDDTRGLSPFDWERVEGKAAKVAIRRGKAIGEGDFT